RFDWDPAGCRFTDEFDVVVFAHCSWYFASTALLRTQLEAAREWAATLCFSEWDAHPYTLAQVPHYLAILAQGQLEAWRQSHPGLASTANVRAPLSRRHALQLISGAGWAIQVDASLDSSMLHDGAWEMAMCQEAARIPALPPLLSSQFDVLQDLTDHVE